MSPLKYNTISFGNLSPQDNKIPPIVNQTAFENVINEINNNTGINNGYNFDFNKLYEKKLIEYYGVNENTDCVVIPSRLSDPANLENNLEKLKALSAKTWCTRGPRGNRFLLDCDFHILFKNETPAMAIKIKNNNVEEIQSVKNDFQIPTEDFIKIRQYIQDLNCITMGRAQSQMQIAKIHQLFMDKCIAASRKQ